MAQLNGFDQNYLANILLDDFKKQTNRLEGAPEIPKRIAEALGRYDAVQAMEAYAFNKKDNKPDYSSATGGEE